ncbi:hypothetical protein PFBG_05201 [Plasmodium falciparum 7G8]|uniref:Uncharacterized protein n=1 Tax=Plasmodium falciparum (isolate 7G8) TaxID=57266 RepID=W7FEQ1_PLAF8|nr:hypothetical protein PFBG_05201 [Plasmodium falciparum 7G8]
MVLSSSVRKDEMNIMDFFPSNSLLYPLDFQKNWQASEPIPLNIHYSIEKKMFRFLFNFFFLLFHVKYIRAYGDKDMLNSLEYHNDLEIYNNEKEEIKRRIISEQKRMEDNLWNKIQLLKIKQKRIENQNYLR